MTRVVDGDTITIRGDTGLVKVRLIGVDTLETVHPWKAVQYYGKEASRFTINLLKGEKVYLTYEGDKPTRDKYGRVLTYVYRAPDGLFVNAEIIRQGYGHAYVRFPFKYLDQFRQIERFARQAGKGLWAPKMQTGAEKPQATGKPIIPPPVVAKPKPKPNSADVTVYVTKTGRKYHQLGCRYLRRSCIPIKLKKAKAGGYGPCSACAPPR